MEYIANVNEELLAKYLAGETTDRENQELEAWLNRSEENRKLLDESKNALEKADAYFRLQQFNTDGAWENVRHGSAALSRKMRVLRYFGRERRASLYKYAALIVLSIFLGSLAYYLGFQNRGAVFHQELVTAQRQVLQSYALPDGSTVTLNSNSKLTFPRKFKGDRREVSIEGEAFFDVVPNPEKPFIIHAGNAQVKVLGTSFSVSAYPGNDRVEVIVETGKVEVIQTNADFPASEKAISLAPGEKGTVFAENKAPEKSVNTNPNFLAWKTHDLIFDKVPLRDVVQCLEKTYHIEIQLAEPALGDLLYEGHFDQKPAEFVLDVIRLTFNLELKGEDHRFTLASRTITP